MHPKRLLDARQRRGAAVKENRYAATDVVAPMYARPQQCVALSGHTNGRPLILSEYSHAMGNSNGGICRVV